MTLRSTFVNGAFVNPPRGKTRYLKAYDFDCVVSLCRCRFGFVNLRVCFVDLVVVLFDLVVDFVDLVIVLCVFV